MARSGLEVADIFRDHGPAWREANRGHVSLDQLKVMSAIERCRTAALGGHVARCENEGCAYTVISYNSLRLDTSPNMMGSKPVSKTIGILAVAAFAASAAGVEVAAITATCRRTRSAAISGRRSPVPPPIGIPSRGFHSPHSRTPAA